MILAPPNNSREEPTDVALRKWGVVLHSDEGSVALIVYAATEDEAGFALTLQGEKLRHHLDRWLFAMRTRLFYETAEGCILPRLNLDEHS